MPNRSSKRDVNQIASSIISHIVELDKKESQKNPAAVALGRLGGLKGGRARAKSLSVQRRKEIAKKAAKARWGKKSK